MGLPFIDPSFFSQEKDIKKAKTITKSWLFQTMSYELTSIISFRLKE